MITYTTELDVVRDLLLGGRHARRTVTRFGVSLPTADRWLAQIAQKIPGIVRIKIGKVTWYEWRPSKLRAAVEGE